MVKNVIIFCLESEVYLDGRVIYLVVDVFLALVVDEVVLQNIHLVVVVHHADVEFKSG